MDDSLLRAEPAELRVVGELAGEGSEILGQRAECAVDDVAGEIARCLNDKVGAATEREGKTVAFERGVGLKDAIGSRVVGIFVDGVRANVFARGGKAQINDANTGDEDLVQGWQAFPS